MEEVVLSQKEITKDDPYFGCIVGRFANRIAEGKFDLEGQTYQLACNLGKHHLHGGKKGWDKVNGDVFSSSKVEVVNLRRGGGGRFHSSSLIGPIVCHL